MTAEIECREKEAQRSSMLAPPRSHGAMNKLIFVSVWLNGCVRECVFVIIVTWRFSLWNFIEPLRFLPLLFLLHWEQCVYAAVLHQMSVRMYLCVRSIQMRIDECMAKRVLKTDWKQASGVYRLTLGYTDTSKARERVERKIIIQKNFCGSVSKHV